jgi:hypothetical protein
MAPIERSRRFTGPVAKIWKGGGRGARRPHPGPPPGLGQADMPRGQREPDINHGPPHGSPQPAPTSHVCRSVDFEDLCKFDDERRGKTGNDVR